MLHHVAAHLVKRGLDAAPQAELPPWTVIIVLIDLVIFIPIIIYIAYTLKCIYPVLSSVEDQNPPPAYQPLPISSKTADDGLTKDPVTTPVPAAIKPVTTSLRDTHKLLRSLGGRRAYVRGFLCLHVQFLLMAALYSVVSHVVPSTLASLATLGATLALAPLSATWVHIVITPCSRRWFWQRLPPFKRTLQATGPALVLYFIASEISEAAPRLIGSLAGVPMPPPNDLGAVDSASEKQAILAFLITLSSPVVFALIGVPAQITLFRIQASLLPADETTIVPFDRTFAGRLEAAGRGYATIKDAWAVTGLNAWKRLVVLHIKLFFVDLAFFVILGTVVAVEFVLVKLAIGN